MCSINACKFLIHTLQFIQRFHHKILYEITSKGLGAVLRLFGSARFPSLKTRTRSSSVTPTCKLLNSCKLSVASSSALLPELSVTLYRIALFLFLSRSLCSSASALVSCILFCTNSVLSDTNSRDLFNLPAF